MNNNFYLVINGFDEFIRFVELIRGKEIDPKEIKKLTKALDVSNDALEKSIEENKNG